MFTTNPSTSTSVPPPDVTPVPTASPVKQTAADLVANTKTRETKKETQLDPAQTDEQKQQSALSAGAKPFKPPTPLRDTCGASRKTPPPSYVMDATKKMSPPSAPPGGSSAPSPTPRSHSQPVGGPAARAPFCQNQLHLAVGVQPQLQTAGPAQRRVMRPVPVTATANTTAAAPAAQLPMRYRLNPYATDETIFEAVYSPTATPGSSTIDGATSGAFLAEPRIPTVEAQLHHISNSQCTWITALTLKSMGRPPCVTKKTFDASAPAASAPVEKQQQQQTTSFEQSEDEDDDDESWATPSEAFSDPEQYCRIAAAVARNRVPDNQELNCFTTSSATSTSPSVGEDLSAGCTPVWDSTKDITQDLTMKKRLQEAESLVLGLEPTACERGLDGLKLEPGQVQTKFHILWSEEMKKRYFPYPLSKTRPTDKWDSYSKDKQRRWKKKNHSLRVHSSNPMEQEPWEGAKFALAQIVALLGSMRERFMLGDVLLSDIRNLDIDVEGVEEWLSTNQGPGEPGGGENAKGTRLYRQMTTFSVIDPATTETIKILAQSTDPGMTGKYPADASFCELDVGLLVVKMSPKSEIDSSSRTSGTSSSSATESSFWGTVSSASGVGGLGSSMQVPSTNNKHKNTVQSRAQRSRRYPSFHHRVGGDRYHSFGLHKLQQQRDLLRKERNFYRDAYHESIHSRETSLRERGSFIAMSASTDVRMGPRDDKSTTATTSRVSKSYENVISCSVSDASPTVNLSLDSYSNNDYVP